MTSLKYHPERRGNAVPTRRSALVPFAPDLYAGWRSSELGTITERLEQDLVLRLAEPIAGRCVLEIGCGEGVLAIALQQQGATVVGMDASWPMLNAARASASGEHADLALCGGRAEHLPFADESFDIVVAVTILCFVPEAERVVTEIVRVLRSGGRLVIGELARWSTWAVGRRCRAWFGSPLWRQGRFRTARELERLARAGGLLPDRVRGAIFYPRWSWAARHLVRLDPWLGARTTAGAAFLALAAQKPPASHTTEI